MTARVHGRSKGPVSRPSFVSPMKALGSTLLPQGVWHCEIKFDGYRCEAVVAEGQVELWSRSRKSMTADFPQIVAELGKLRCRDAVIDGEIVALDAKGRSRFQLLQNRGAESVPSNIVYFAFDLMHLDGTSLLANPLEERTDLLRGLLGRGGRHLQPSKGFSVEPSILFAEAKKNGLEGIIAKKPGSRYEADRRSGAWLKCKVLAEQEMVIGGFTQPQNSRKYFGALVVGYYENGGLRYAGKVGTGFDGRALESLHRTLAGKAVLKCPFVDIPRQGRPRFGAGMGSSEMKSVTWVRPTLVVQVKFAEWTGDGLLRQPVFLGLRTDKAATEVVREAGPTEKGR